MSPETTTGTFTQLSQSHATSIVFDEYFFATANVYKGGNDDAEIGRVCEATSSRSVIALDQLAR
jgi:hypothetical protein